jgi:hypothetical protein
MGCLEGSGVPVLYIGRMVPKGYNISARFCAKSSGEQRLFNHPVAAKSDSPHRYVLNVARSITEREVNIS